MRIVVCIMFECAVFCILRSHGFCRYFWSAIVSRSSGVCAAYGSWSYEIKCFIRAIICTKVDNRKHSFAPITHQRTSHQDSRPMSQQRFELCLLFPVPVVLSSMCRYRYYKTLDPLRLPLQNKTNTDEDLVRYATTNATLLNYLVEFRRRCRLCWLCPDPWPIYKSVHPTAPAFGSRQNTTSSVCLSTRRCLAPAGSPGRIESVQRQVCLEQQREEKTRVYITTQTSKTCIAKHHQNRILRLIFAFVKRGSLLAASATCRS